MKPVAPVTRTLAKRSGRLAPAGILLAGLMTMAPSGRRDNLTGG
jgi:hypothetical protein